MPLRNIISIGSPLGKLHFIGLLISTAFNTFIVLNEDKNTRMALLVIVLILQQITFLLFMVDYERLGRIQWQRREESLKQGIKVSSS